MTGVLMATFVALIGAAATWLLVEAMRSAEYRQGISDRFAAAERVNRRRRYPFDMSPDRADALLLAMTRVCGPLGIPRSQIPLEAAGLGLDVRPEDLVRVSPWLRDAFGRGDIAIPPDDRLRNQLIGFDAARTGSDTTVITVRLKCATCGFRATWHGGPNAPFPAQPSRRCPCGGTMQNV